MPIKFGDLIENANTSYALIDLTDNQSRGVCFLDNFGTVTAETNSSALAAVPQDKRRKGMLLVIKSEAQVYILEADPNDGSGGYTDPLFQIVPTANGTPWRAVGQLDLQNTNIVLNIDEAKSFGKYKMDFVQTVDDVEYTGEIPVEAWMDLAEAGEDSPVASALGATALEIIIDALNETFPLVPAFQNLTLPQDLKFNQQSIPSSTYTTSLTCPRVNDEDIVNFKLYRREVGQDNWVLFAEIEEGGITNDATDGTTTVAVDIPAITFSSDYYDFSGLQLKVEATDASGATGESVVTRGREDYHHPRVSNVVAERIYDNSTFAKNETDTLRVAANVDSRISFDVQVEQSANDDTIKNGTHKWQVFYRVWTNSTTAGDWQAASQKTVFTPGAAGLSQNITFDHEDGDAPATSSQQIQYKVVVWDSYTEASVTPETDILLANGDTGNSWEYNYFSGTTEGSGTNNSNSPYVKLRYPVFLNSILLTDQSDVGDTGQLAAVNETVEDEIIAQMTGTGGLAPAAVTTPAIGNAAALDFPRLYEGGIPTSTLTTFAAFNNAQDNGFPNGSRFYFAYADNNGPISMEDNANATIQDINVLEFGVNTTNQIDAFIQHETGTSSGITIHGRLTGAGADYTAHTRKIQNVDYQILIQRPGNAITSDIRIKI